MIPNGSQVSCPEIYFRTVRISCWLNYKLARQELGYRCRWKALIKYLRKVKILQQWT
jgi:hypothetical protein